MVTLLNAPAPKKNIWGRLGAAAGQGLEEGMENRRLAQAEELKHQRALELQGNLQNNKAQELAGKQQRQLISQDIATKLLRGERVSPEEESFLLQENPQAYKTLKPKESKQALTEKPVPEEISNKINQILEKNPKDSADKLRIKMDKAGIPPVYSNPYTENRRRDDESSKGLDTKKVEMALSRDNDILKESEKIRTLIPTEESSIAAMKEGILLGDQSFFSGNNLAERTGLEYFRDAAGGLFKTGSKTFLINNITKFGARPNQYIEQQISDSLAKVGRSKAANISSVALVEFDSNVKKEFLSQIDKVSENDYKAGTLGKEVQKNMKKYVEFHQQRLADKLKFIQNHEKEIDETPKDHYPMIDPEGRLIYIPQDQIDEAIFRGAIEL